MAGETFITVIGHLTADPDLRETATGLAVANFTVASTPRFFSRDSQEWVDGETLFQRCSIWRDYAKNVAESLRKGDLVIAFGALEQQTYETKPTDGSAPEKRYTTNLRVEHVGPALRKNRVNIVRTTTATPPSERAAEATTRAQAKRDSALVGAGVDQPF